MADPSLDRLAPLAEPVRRALYEHVLAQPAPVDRDAAAAAVGIRRTLAAFHLDRLVAGGLLEVEFHRRSGRSGPGAGRPAKFYRPARGAVLEVSIPPRRYGLAARVFAEGIEQAGDRAAEAVLERARAAGQAMGSGVGGDGGTEDLVTLLRTNGYEPVPAADGSVRLRNCPFDALVAEHRALTCSMNLAMLGAVAAEAPGAGVAAVADPRDGWCCVALVPRPADGPAA